MKGEQLLEELRILARRVDGPPAWVHEAAKAAFDWRTLDTELAELVYDSALAPAQAGVRSDSASRLLSFESADLSVEIEVVQEGSTRRLVGQVAPPQLVHVRVVGTTGERLAFDSDELGRFSIADLPAGPVSFLCQPGQGTPTRTSWTIL